MLTETDSAILVILNKQHVTHSVMKPKVSVIYTNNNINNIHNKTLLLCEDSNNALITKHCYCVKTQPRPLKCSANSDWASMQKPLMCLFILG